MRTQLALTMFLSAAVGCAEGPAPQVAAVARTDEGLGQCHLTHASYTTFADPSACDQGPNPNGVNCNIYTSKDGVYLSGGPAKQTLPDGTYFFVVLVPGAQNSGLADGADGNLSQDTMADRTFSIVNGQIVYTGVPGGSIHQLATRDGNTIIQLMPYADTTNPGGEYTTAICVAPLPGASVDPCSCKYDNFKVKCGETSPPPPTVSGGKYYDADLDGAWGSAEAGIAGWKIDFVNSTAGVNGRVVTDGNGEFSDQALVAGSYVWTELTGNSASADGVTFPIWIQTGNTVDQSSNGSLQSNMTYAFDLVDGESVFGIYFGNVCIGGGPGGAFTLGFWSNKNGQALYNASDVAALDALPLRNANGTLFVATKTNLRSWLLGATATNMAYMLSAQLATMQLNVDHAPALATALIYAPGTNAGAANKGFATVSAVMAEAVATLAANGLVLSGNPERAHQEAVKNALDMANNNLNFLEPSADKCPAPTFAP